MRGPQAGGGRPRGCAGFVDAPPHWLPALAVVDPAAVWERIIAVLPDDAAAPPGITSGWRPPTSPALAALDPSIAWIPETWGGLAGLLAAGIGVGRGCRRPPGGRRGAVLRGHAVRGHRRGDRAQAHRGRGLSTSCAAAVVADIRARGRRPTWTTSPDNTGSLAVAARLGFAHVRDDVLYAVRTPIPV